MRFDRVYYEPGSLEYPLGRALKEKFAELPWNPVETHNNIPELRSMENAAFAHMKRFLIIGTRKTHKYVENHKISDYLVPYTSSGCTAMCLYCYLVCNYNKCAYLRLFVNREQMLERLIRVSLQGEEPHTFEIGSNSDLVLENTITGNLVWTIPEFVRAGRGRLTFPTKFDMVEPLLPLAHGGRVVFRMSVNPADLIRRVELGTAPLDRRIAALNQMCAAGYPCGILIAPIMYTPDWRVQYGRLLEQLADELSGPVKRQLFMELIFMTYSFIHREINRAAFPAAPELYRSDWMVGRGRGKYAYRPAIRAEMEEFLRAGLARLLPEARIVYVS